MYERTSHPGSSVGHGTKYNRGFVTLNIFPSVYYHVLFGEAARKIAGCQNQVPPSYLAPVY